MLVEDLEAELNYQRENMGLGACGLASCSLPICGAVRVVL